MQCPYVRNSRSKAVRIARIKADRWEERRLSFSRTAAALALVLTVAAACGGSSPPTGSTKPLVIGAVLPLSGNAGGSGHDSIIGLEQVIDQINKAGGVLGRPLTFQTRDDASDTNKAVLAAQDLLANVHPDFMIPENNTTQTLAILPLTSSAKIITIDTASSTAAADVSKFPYQFEDFLPSGSQGVAFASVAKQLASQAGETPKLGILMENGASGQFIAAATKSAAQAQGIEVAGQQSYQTGTQDLTIYASKLKSAGVNIIACHGFGTDAANSIKAVEALGWTNVTLIGNPTWLSTGASLETLIPADIASRVYVIAPVVVLRSSSAAPTDPWHTAVAALGPPSSLIGPAAIHDSITLWAWAVNKVGSLDPDKVKAQLEKLSTLPASQLPQDLQIVPNPGWSATVHDLSNSDLSHAWGLMQRSSLIAGTYQGVVLNVPELKK
jgi:branched-chain amino acid transport system substrate-binding protein